MSDNKNIQSHANVYKNTQSSNISTNSFKGVPAGTNSPSCFSTVTMSPNPNAEANTSMISGADSRVKKQPSLGEKLKQYKME